MKKVLFHTLGCKVNQYETEALRNIFLSAEYTTAAKGEPPDVIVINSCTVTDHGDKKTVRQLRRLRRDYPDACIALCGCFPQAFPEEAAALQEADVITGNVSRRRLLPLVETFFSTRTQQIELTPYTDQPVFEDLEAVSFAERTRAYLKIQDGCNRRCAYCIIPDARGDLRSKPFDDLKAELKKLAASGYLEVVLVGINLSTYGNAFGKTLADAVEAAEEVDGILRVRLGSLEPDLLTDETLIRLSRCKKLCPQFHIALQSGCDATLARMRRKYTTTEYAQLTERLRKYFDNTALTTDVMVGFPGESTEEFEASKAFVKSIGFSKVHVFPYSVRPGTPAAHFPDQVSEETKACRSKDMILLADNSREAFLNAKIGKIAEVLVEKVFDDCSIGHDTDYTLVLIPAKLQRNTIVSVRIREVSDDRCIGEIC